MRTLNVCKASLIIVLSLVQFTVGAKVKLPSLFSNGMVLQRESNVSIWGMSDKKTVTITTSWNGQKYEAEVGPDQKWRAEITTIEAGGPHSIRVSDGDGTVVIKDVLLGEVWLASGAVNMAMSFRGTNSQRNINNADKIVANSDNPQIRFFNVRAESWGQPKDDVRGNWRRANPKNTVTFSAVAYCFARELHEQLDVPVAIIQSSALWSPITAWMSAESLTPFQNVKVNQVGDKAYKKQVDHTGFYNGMIHPLLGYGIKGAVWYQGEANRPQAMMYAQLFQTMVQHWRQAWGIGDFPFYYVQIAPFSNIMNMEAGKVTDRHRNIDRLIPYFRDAQLISQERIPNSGMAVLMDIGSVDNVYPSEREMIGKRLSYWALNKTYGKQAIPYSGPTYRDKKVEGNTMVLSFDYAEGLYLKNGTSQNFEIAGSDRTFHPATAVVKGSEVHVSAPGVEKPIAVRYAFRSWAEGDLFNKHQLPASSFRTDNWTVNQVAYSTQ